LRHEHSPSDVDVLHPDYFGESDGAHAAASTIFGEDRAVLSDNPIHVEDLHQADDLHRAETSNIEIPQFSNSFLACMDMDSPEVSDSSLHAYSLRSPGISSFCTQNDNAMDGFGVAESGEATCSTNCAGPQQFL
jgi:hypothetical protein